MVYFEDIPQFILLTYVLWITPLECFFFDWNIFYWENLTYANWKAGKFDDFITCVNMLITFLSISATAVPFYEQNKDKDW